MIARTLAVLCAVAIVAGVVALVYTAPKTIIVLVFAVFFAYILEPLVKASSRWSGVSRAAGIAITYLLLLAAIGILAWLSGATILRQTRELRNTLPSLVDQVASGRIAQIVGEEHQWTRDTIEYTRHFLIEHRDTIVRQSNKLHHYLSALAANIMWILLIPVLAVFFLAGKEEFGRAALQLVNAAKHRSAFRTFIQGMDWMLAHYIRAKLLLVLFALAGYTGFLLIIQMPFGLAIGLIAGVLEFIPVFGPLLSLAIQLGMAAALNFGHLIVLAVYWIVFRGFQDVVLMPKVMRRELKLPALLSITAVLMGGEAAGVLGMFLSIPVILTARVIWRSTVEIN